MDQRANAAATLPSETDTIDELFAKQYSASLRIATRLLRSREDAEDAVQTAFYFAFRNIHNFRGESTFKTWITRIVVNCCLMLMRERSARPEVALEEVQAGVASHALTPEALCYARELQAAHAKAASKLPPSLKVVYAPLLSDIAFSTVAHRLGLTSAAAKSRLFRARRRVEHAFQTALRGRAA